MMVMYSIISFIVVIIDYEHRRGHHRHLFVIYNQITFVNKSVDYHSVAVELEDVSSYADVPSPWPRRSSRQRPWSQCWPSSESIVWT